MKKIIPFIEKIQFFFSFSLFVTITTNYKPLLKTNRNNINKRNEQQGNGSCWTETVMNPSYLKKNSGGKTSTDSYEKSKKVPI